MQRNSTGSMRLGAVGRWLRVLVDLLFGYDYFISYAHDDGIDYPRALLERLESSGFRVFLDARVYVAGDDLHLATRRRVRMSKKLVVIIGSRALHSEWVLREIQQCLQAGRVPIAIDVNAALRDAPTDNEVKRVLQDKLYLSERIGVDDSGPSEATVQGLIRSFRATRQDTQRLRIVSAAAVLFALAAVVAVWQSKLAEDRRKEAVRQQQQAQSRALAASAEAQVTVDPEVSVLLSLESLAVAETEEAEEALRHALPDLYAEMTLAGHDDQVQVARYSTDGRRILTAGFDGTARIWKSDGGSPVTVLHGHRQAVTDAAFSPDGTRVATVGVDDTVRVWNAVTGVAIHVFAGFGARPAWVTFSPDGALVLASTAKKSPRAWNAKTGASLETGVKTNGVVSRDGRWMVTQGDDEAVVILEAATQRPIARLRVDGAYVPGGITANASRLLTGDGRGDVTVWNTATGNRDGILSGHDGAVVAVAFDQSDGAMKIATASEDFTARIWTLKEQGITSVILRGHTATVNEVAFSPDGRWLATASADRTVRLWDVISGRPVAELRGHGGSVTSVMFHPSGEKLLSAGGRSARVWRVSAEQTVTRYWRRADAPQKVAINRNGGLLVTSGTLGDLALWGARTGLVLAPIPSSAGIVLEADFHPGGRYLALGGLDGVVRVWDEGRRRMVQQFRGHQGAVLSVAFSPDGASIASGGADASVRLWRARQDQPIATLTAHTAAVLSVAFSPDGTRIASGGGDHTVRIWDATTHTLVGAPLQHAANVKSIDFGADGGQLVTATDDHLAQIWDVATQALVRQLEHPAGVTNAMYTPAGEWVVTGCEDGQLRIWDPATGKLVGSMKTRAPRVRRIALGAKGHWILTAESDDAAYRYPWEMAAPLSQLREIAAARLQRGLTAAERRRFLP